MLTITLPAWGFPGSSVGKEPTSNAGDPSSIPGLGRSPGEAIDYPLQYSWTSLVGSAGKESTCNAGDPSSIPGLGRSPGEGIGYPLQFLGFPCGSAGKESACNAGDLAWIPWLGRSPGGGNGYPFQYSCLEKPMDREAWQATVHRSQRARHD